MCKRIILPKLLISLLLGLGQIACAEDIAERAVELEKQVAALVERLGDDHYKSREQAHRKLLAIGKDALLILEKIDEPNDPEMRLRLGNLINTFKIHPLQGTKWHIEYTSEVILKDVTIEFLAEGAFRALDTSKKSPADETWDQPEAHPDGNIVRFYFNNKYSTYEGHRINRETIVGSSENIKGVKWTWRATLVE